MSSGSHFEFNPEAVRQLLLSPEMEAALEQYAAGYEGEKQAWRSSSRVAIQIRRDSNDNNKMLKDLFSLGGDK